MNSGYGKNLIKAVLHTTHMSYNKKDFEIFESRNYNQIYESTFFSNSCVKSKTY